jgi:flagellar basal-body rod protein FlgC
MGMFSAIGIAGTGVTVYRKWLDAVSDNLANVNNAAPTSGPAFRARYVVARAAGYGSGEGGVQVGGVALGDAAGRLVYEPSNPIADKDGYVRYPDIDMGAQMGQLIMAQRGYQANLTVVDRAKDAYEAALQIGKG